MPDRRPKDPQTEILDRVRRIETRVTQTAIAMGVRTEGKRPEFTAMPGTATLVLPSPHCSMREIVESIPSTWSGPVGVFIGDRLVATVTLPGS